MGFVILHPDAHFRGAESAPNWGTKALQDGPQLLLEGMHKAIGGGLGIRVLLLF
jgi:hypothetical protein